MSGVTNNRAVASTIIIESRRNGVDNDRDTDTHGFARSSLIDQAERKKGEKKERREKKKKERKREVNRRSKNGATGGTDGKKESAIEAIDPRSGSPRNHGGLC